MPTAYMMVGFPGSGKSTYVKKLKEENPDLVVLSIDDCVHFLAKQLGTTYDKEFLTLVGQAEKMMWNFLDMAIDRNLDVVFDQTNLTIKSRKKKLNYLPMHYKRICVLVDPGATICMERLNNSDRDKTIPDYVFDGMVQSFVLPKSNEGFDEIVVYA